MAFDVRFTERYLADLNAAIDNLWLVSQAATERFAGEHDARIVLLRTYPRIGAPRPRNRRSIPIGKTGYHILYRLDGERLTLLRLQNTRRAR
jgi:plasmid stabilization system protein ParE